MVAPLYDRVAVLAAKAEDTPGEAEELTGAEAAFNVFSPNPEAQIEMEEREGQGGVGIYLPSAPAGRLGQITFATEVYAPTSTPLWAETFLPAVGLGNTGSVYVIDPKPPEAEGSTQQTLTIGYYTNGLFEYIYGAMGTLVMTFDAAKKVRFEWIFKGIYGGKTDVAILDPTYPADVPMRFVASSLAVGDWNPQVAQFKIDLGNEIYVREDSSTASGFSSAVIGTRRIKGTMNPEAALVATKDTQGDWLGMVEAALSFNISNPTSSAAFAASKLQIVNIKRGNRSRLLTDEIDFVINSDDLSITLTPPTP